MSSQNPYPPQNNASFPALHLYPLDDSFVPKRIALGGGQRVKIARPPNTKTQPAERNGYFDSRVLSRQHAEVWEEGNKIFIKDVKSSNGTFINGERLSLEGRESEPYELKSDDILEFGVDIVSEDNKTVLHRKVVARVACVFSGSKNGLGLGSGSGSGVLPHDQFATMSQAGAGSFNGMPGPAQRRPQQVPMIHQGLAGLGGMGGGVRAPGRGLTLDHIFSRLQAELAKSRDTGHDLQVLTGALNNIEDTLNGALPPTSLPPFPDVLPGVRPPHTQQPQRAMSLPSVPPVVGELASAANAIDLQAANESADPQDLQATSAIAELQAQLREHQEALAAHIEGVRALESVLSEQEAMKREVRELRTFVGVDRRAYGGDRDQRMEGGKGEDMDGTEGEGEPEGEEGEEEGEDDDSDTRSIMTATPQERELDDIEEEEEGFEQLGAQRDAERDAARSAQKDADALQEEREENMRRERAQTPEPTDSSPSPSPPRSPRLSAASSPPKAESLGEMSPSESSTLSLSELTTRLVLLTAQLESALAASSALQAQHTSAQMTIAGLEEKIAKLEAHSSSSPPLPTVGVSIPIAPAVAAVVPSLAVVSGLSASASNANLEEMHAQLAAVRTELARERGAREAFEERIRLVTANGALTENTTRRRRVSRGRSGSSGRSRSASPGFGGEMDDSMRLDQVERALELRPLKSSLAVGGVHAEKSLRANGAGTAMVQLNTQTALGVLILGIAAAAVLWRVKPE